MSARSRAAIQAAVFAGIGCVGLAVLLFRAGSGYFAAALVLAVAFGTIGFLHRRRLGHETYAPRVSGRSASPRVFWVRDVLLPVALFVVGTSAGYWFLGEVASALDVGLNLPAVLVAGMSAGAMSFALIAWLGRG